MKEPECVSHIVTYQDNKTIPAQATDNRDRQHLGVRVLSHRTGIIIQTVLMLPKHKNPLSTGNFST